MKKRFVSNISESTLAFLNVTLFNRAQNDIVRSYWSRDHVVFIARMRTSYYCIRVFYYCIRVLSTANEILLEKVFFFATVRHLSTFV